MKKVMLVPSKKFKLVKNENLKLIEKVLYILAIVNTFLNYYLYSFMHSIKFISIVAVSIVVVREFEILFYSHNKNISRADAKELIRESYPELLALIYAFLIPVGTPLWIVAFGAILATFLGKLILGGFTHSVFNPSLVGALYITFGYSVMATTYEFKNSLTNVVFKWLFNNKLFNEILAFPGTNVFNASSISALNGFETYTIGEVMFGGAPGIVIGGVFILIACGYLIYKKAINYIIPAVSIISLFVMYLILGKEFSYGIYNIFTGAFLFVVVFAGSDVITIPTTNYGKIIFGIIVGVLTVLIREAGTYSEGAIFALLFANMLSPMFNYWFDKKKPVKKAGAK